MIDEISLSTSNVDNAITITTWLNCFWEWDHTTYKWSRSDESVQRRDYKILKYCGDCRALVYFGTPRTCNNFCKEYNLVCVWAYEDDIDDECEISPNLPDDFGCDYDFRYYYNTGDWICQCRPNYNVEITESTTFFSSMMTRWRYS
jgi:hypothetical protein